MCLNGTGLGGPLSSTSGPSLFVPVEKGDLRAVAVFERLMCKESRAKLNETEMILATVGNSTREDGIDFLLGC